MSRFRGPLLRRAGFAFRSPPAEQQDLQARKSALEAELKQLEAEMAKAQAVRLAAALEIPVEILDEVSSKKKAGYVAGSTVRGAIWGDVVVDGFLAIRDRTPVVMVVTRSKRAKIAGISGKLTIEARSTTAVDGTPVDLVGGYGMKGKGRESAAWASASLVAWPLVFIKGKQARVPGGTVVFSSVARTTEVRTSEEAVAPTWDAIASVESKKTLAVELIPLEDQDMPETVRIVKIGGNEVRMVKTHLGEELIQVEGKGAGRMRPALSPVASGVARFDLELFIEAMKTGRNYMSVEVAQEIVPVLLPAP